MADGGWRMAYGEWLMANGGWRMAYGEWLMADGGWRMANGRWDGDGGMSYLKDWSLVSG